jgi:hypothetical protein
VLWALMMILIRTIGVLVRAQRVGAKIDFSEVLPRRRVGILGRTR